MVYLATKWDTFNYTDDNSFDKDIPDADSKKIIQHHFKVTPTTFWLKCINLSKCTKFCSTHKLEVAGKCFDVLIKNYLMEWQIRGLKDGISGNILVVYSNLWAYISLVSIGGHMQSCSLCWR